MITIGAVMEILWVMGVAFLGALWWERDELPRWVAPAVSLLTGAAVLAVAGALVVAVRLPAPLHLVAVVGIALLAPGLLGRRRRPIVGPGELVAALPFLAVVVPVVQIMRHDAPVAVHSDSFRYVAGARAFLEGDHATLTAGLPKYGLAQQVLHAPAELFGTAGWMSLAPLTALSTVIVVAWAVTLAGGGPQPSARSCSRRTVRVESTVAIVLLATNPWFLMHAVYLNAHLLIGALVVLSAVLLSPARRSLTAGPSSQRAFANPVVGVLLAAVVLLRAEGALLAGLVLLPTIFGSSRGGLRPEDVRGAVPRIWSIVGSVTVIFGLVAPTGRDGSVLIGVGLITLLAPHVALKLPPWSRQWGLVAIEGMLWAATFALLVAPRSTQLNRSLRPTVGNVIGEGSGWGRGALPLLALIVVAVVWHATRPVPDRLPGLRFPLTAFVPLGLLLAAGRGGAYRLAFEDSLNRMWIQVLPLGVALIGAMLVRLLEDRGPRRPSIRVGNRALSLVSAATILVSATAAATPLAGAAITARPVAGAQELVRQVPFGELTTGMQVTGVLRPNILPTLRASDLDRPACVEVLFANYADRQNAGTLRLSFGPPGGGVSARPHGVVILEAASVADNRPQRACSADVTVRDVLAEPEGVEVRIEGVQGRAGSSVTVWLTEDLTDGQLLDPVDPQRSLVARIVVEQETIRLLPTLPIVIGLIWGMVMLVAIATTRRPGRGLGARQA